MVKGEIFSFTLSPCDQIPHGIGDVEVESCTSAVPDIMDTVKKYTVVR